MPPTPESPAKPCWWEDGHDDARAAELLYMLFGAKGEGASLERDIEDWVLRENAVAAEAFPEMEFWRGLDIRWIRYSCAHAGVGEALKELKARVARGEGQMQFVAVDGSRQKRSRKTADEKRDEKHPVQALLS